MRKDMVPTNQKKFAASHNISSSDHKEILYEDSQEELKIKESKKHLLVDDEILKEAKEILNLGHTFNYSGIEVEVYDQSVVLSGYVETRIDKQIAERLVESLFNVKDVLNQLKVKVSDRLPIKRIENLGGLDG